MDAIDAILTRRSVRNYKEENISDEILDKIIEAGFSAPSAGNQQPWHFIKIDDKEILKGFIKFHPHARMLKNSNKGILICGDPELETFVGYWTIDC